MHENEYLCKPAEGGQHVGAQKQHPGWVRWLATLAVLGILILAAGCGGGGQPPSSASASGTGSGSGGDSGGGQGGGGSLLAEIKERGYMTFANDAAYPPMEFADPTNPEQVIGFDIDLGKAIAEKLGVEHRVVVVDWDGLLAGLQARQFDAVMSAMNITEDRKAGADFVPYVEMGQLIVVKKGNPKGIRGLEDLKGKKIAVLLESTNEKLARTIEGAEVVTFPSFPDALQEVANGRADATILDEPVAYYYVKTQPDQYEIVGDVLQPMPVGIALPKGETELVQAVQQALDELKADGTYDQIYEKWFGKKP
ncbi:MAG: basic amino acid ABC transporter substrate-binding protein [Bacillota bacterium]|nr:MAG: basic amino acid ABC transporter substrate-binding protein [Bacillota bacterium]